MSKRKGSDQKGGKKEEDRSKRGQKHRMVQNKMVTKRKASTCCWGNKEWFRIKMWQK